MARISKLPPLESVVEVEVEDHIDLGRRGVDLEIGGPGGLRRPFSQSSLRRPKYTVEISSLGVQAGSGDRLCESPPTCPGGGSAVTYKLYKRRWIGLLQLVLFNLMFGWSWLTFPSISSHAQLHFRVSPTAITGLSVAFAGAICLMAPGVAWIIHKAGLRSAFIISAVTLLIGSWTRYFGTEGWSFGAVVFGNIVLGMGASFALVLPTHYSDLWFSPAGRMGATTVASLAYPAGIVVGKLASPYMGLLPLVVLWTSVISTALSLGTFFISVKPPTPASASHLIEKTPPGMAFFILIRNKKFWLLLIPFAVYVGLFISMASFLYGIYCPYVGDPDFSGFCGALCISGALVATLILSPFIAKPRSRLITLKILTPIIGLCYLVFIWLSEIQHQIANLVVIAVLEGATLILIPTTLEYLVDSLHPIAPETTSSLCWMGGQFFGIIFISVMEILNVTDDPVPPIHIKSALIFQVIFALVVVPLPFCLGIAGRPLACEDYDPRSVAQI